MERYVGKSGNFRILRAVTFLVLLTARYAEACPAIGVANNKVVIPDSHMSATSEFSHLRVASTARLNGAYGWEPSVNYDPNDNLVIDLGAVYNICAVATQGNGGPYGLGQGYQEWTKSYFLRYSVNSTGWLYYQEGGQNKEFAGNSDTNTIVKNTLHQPVLARFVSFQPKDYETHKALRVEVYGVKVAELSHICPNDTCIYFTDEKNLRALDVEAKDYKTVVPNLVTCMAVDVLVRERTVFWSDEGRGAIAKVDLKSGKIEDIVTGVNSKGIAVDWMAHVIYWGDFNLKSIEVAQLDGHNRKVLFNTEISFPEDVAVDPAIGYLFWSDNEIYRSTLAGENRTVIVNTASRGAVPKGIVLDYERRYIYWLDYWHEYIEGATYNGHGYKRHVRLSTIGFVFPVSLTILGDIFYWTDEDHHSIERVNKTSMTLLPNIFGKINNIRGIAAAEISRQPLGSTACLVNNGNCSNLCLLSTGGSRKCYCPSGKVLAPDGLTCQELTDFIIVTEPGASAMKKVWIDDIFSANAFNPSHVYNPIGIACDAVNKRVYWTDNYRKAVYMTNFNATLSVQIASAVKGRSRVAFDSTSRNLYITEDVEDKVVIANLAGNKTRKKTIATIKNPQSITLDIKDGYMYISSCPFGANHTIVKADMDGKNPNVLVTLGESRPVGLVLDKANNRLYWIEKITKKIRYVQLKNVSQILTLQTLNFTVRHLEMTDILNYLYIVESGSWYEFGAVYRVDKTTGMVTKIVSSLWQPSGICGYSKTRQPPAVGACTNNNGGCGDAMCVTKPSDKTCMCPDGHKLTGSTCDKLVDHIFLAETFRISKFFSEEASSKASLPLSYIDEPNSLAYDEENGYLFWTDDYYSDINRAKLDGALQSQLVRNVEKPDSVALDTIAGVIYWVDRANNVVEVARMDGRYRAVVLAEVPTPKSIALDLPNKYIYIAAWSGLNHTIIRADLDGMDRRVLATIGQAYPTGLVLDSGANRVCWCHEKAKQISCLSLSTFAVTKLADVPEAVFLTGMTLQGNYLWVTDRGNSTVKGSVYRCSKTSGTCTSFLSGQTKPRGIVANSTVYKGYSPCMDNNGNCSHLCLQSRQSQGHVCVCPNGMVSSNGTGKSCFYKEFLLIVQHFYSYGLLWKVPLNIKNPHIAAVPVLTYKPVAVDYDYQDLMVYWSDVTLRTISRAFLNGSDSRVVVSGLGSPQGLAVDGVARNLYFTDVDRNTLEVVNLNGSFRRVLFNVIKPYDIALDTWEAKLYYSSCGTNPSIEMASMTGQENKTLHKWSFSSSHCPHGLHYDRPTRRLYFTDGGFHSCYYITTDSRIITEMSHLPALVEPFGLTMDDTYLYLTNNGDPTQSVYQVDKLTGTKVVTVMQASYSSYYDIHVYKNITSPANLHPCNLGTSGCSHLCLPHQYGYRCECPNMPPVANCTAYDMINLPPTPPPPLHPCESSPCMEGGTCIEFNTTRGVDFACNCSAEHTGRRCQLYKGERPPVLYFANEKKIDALAIGSTNVTSVATELDFAVAIDVDVKRNLLFFSDWSSEIIYRKNLTSGALDKIITNGAISVEGIAVDWEACNIYWTDYILENVEVASCDGKYRKVLFHEGVYNARGIAVDPRNGYLFWTDWGTFKIERATLAGDERKVIVPLVDHGAFISNGLTIDYESNRLFWIDDYADQIGTCDFNGGYLTFVAKLSNQVKDVRPYDLALYDRTIFWSETNDETIHRYDLKRHLNLPNIYGPVGYVLGLTVDHHTRQPRGSQACAVNNGGCSQLCLLTPKGRKCACATAFKLAEDNFSCLEIATKLLVTEAGRSHINLIHHDEEYAMATIPVNPKTTLYNPAAIAYDPLNKRMCWVDSMRYKIYCSLVNGSFAEEVVGGTEGAEQLAIDWSGDKLYWTASPFNKIEVSTISGKYRMALITENLEAPHGICLDLINRYIYFTTWANGSHTIERSDMDGGNRLLLANVGLSKPTSLNLESSTSRLYFLEAATSNVRYVNLSSSTYDVYNLLSFKHKPPTYQLRMTVDGPNIFIVDSGYSWLHFGGVYRCNNTMIGGCERVMEGLVDPNDIVAFNSSYTPPPVTTECSANNGGCEQLCLLKQSGYRCACSDASVLNPDKKTCKVMVDFLVFAEYGTGRLTKVYPEKPQAKGAVPLSYLLKPEAVAYDPQRLEIYWSDVSYEDLNKATLDGKQRVIARDAYAAGIAIDVVTGNVYWTNAKHGIIEVATYNGTYRATLISGTLHPKGIVLDLVNKYIFWGSFSHSNHKIERADMDGNNRITVANVGDVSPYGIFLHSDENRICWVEEFELRVRCSTPTFNGKISVLVDKLSGAVHPADAAVLAGSLYVTDIEQGVIHKCHDTKCEKFLTGIKSPKGIVSNANATTGESSCTVNNGGCSHICLQSRSPRGRTCECPRGMVHNGTNSCFFKEFMIVAVWNYYFSDLYRIPLAANARMTRIPIKKLILRCTAVTFDQQELKVYWAESGLRKGIYRALLNGSNVEDLLTTKLLSPQSLTLDTIARNIYWLDASANKIEVCAVDDCTRTRKTLFDISKPRSLVIDTFSGYMFFSSCGTQATVEKAWLDGTNRKTIKAWSALSRHCITELSFDRIGNKLFWIDTRFNYVEVMDLSTLQIHRWGALAARHPRTLAIDENYVYWGDAYLSSIAKGYKNTGAYAGEVVANVYRATDIHVFKNVTLFEDTHPCTDKAISNCSDLCLLNPEGYHCACADASVGCSSTTIKITTTPSPTTAAPTTTEAPTTAPNLCEPNPCENGGTCDQSDHKFECECPDEYADDVCGTFYGDDEVNLSFEEDLEDYNETAFRIIIAEICNTPSENVEAKRRRRSASNSPVIKPENVLIVKPPEQIGKLLQITFVVLIPAQSGRNKTVFTKSKLQAIVATHADVLAEKVGAKVAKIDGKSPEAYTSERKGSPKTSTAGRDAAIVIVVLLIIIVAVVLAYLYKTRWSKVPARKLMRNESVRSITDFNNPGYMVEEETTRSRDDNPNPMQMAEIKSDGSFANPTYEKMSLPPARPQPYQAPQDGRDPQPRPPMRKLPLHESLASPFYESPGDPGDFKKSTDIDNNTAISSQNVYVDVKGGKPSEYAGLDAKTRDAKRSAATLHLDGQQPDETDT